MIARCVILIKTLGINKDGINGGIDSNWLFVCNIIAINSS